MKVPLSWLKDFVDINMSVEKLSDNLISCGFEIEEVIYLKDKIQKVVTGKIVSVSKHPNADRLLICQVDIGNKQITVVTGADNINSGDIVPVALDGATLPATRINAGEIRKILSEGMFCGGEDLELTEADFDGAGVNGILILPNDTQIGVDINDIIGNNDIVLDVAITANRQDCNSILGIAREVAAVTKQKLRLPSLDYKVTTNKIEDYLTVENTDYELCPRYMAMVVENIKIEKSPKLIRNRLRAVGIRPINNFVDITNYILIEIGQPLHAFDLELIEDKKIVVRKAKSGETITALDGNEYNLDKNNLLICDSRKPIAVAGVMGGEFSSVNPNTQVIALESAAFAKDSVRHTSRKLNLRSDSSQRFEKGIDILSQEIGLNRALSLIDKYGWGEVVSGFIDCNNLNFDNQSISCNYQQINSVLCIDIYKNIICEVLNLLEIRTSIKGDVINCIIPLFRIDIEGINDLAEEVIRIYGYKHIIPTLLTDTQMTRGGKTKHQKMVDRIKSVLVSHGLFEIISYSFISPKAFDMLQLSEDNILRKAIKLRNPLSEELSVMRTTLAYSMIKTMAYNIVRGNKKGTFFEYAKVYIPKSLPLKELPNEKYTLCIGCYGEEVDYYSLKNGVDDILQVLGIEVKYKRSKVEYLHTGRGADIIACNNEVLGHIGEVHPDVIDAFNLQRRLYLAEISVEKLLDNAIKMVDYNPISKYQAVERDIALIMDKDLEIDVVLNTIKSQSMSLIENIEVFDIYEGSQVAKGKKSAAINLRFRHSKRTLIDEEVNKIIDNILNALKKIDVNLRH